MGKLTTHVLDLNSGTPAAAMRIELQLPSREMLATSQLAFITNSDGRITQPMLEGVAFKAGCYALIFHVADYFRAQGAALPDPPFLDQVRIEFGIADPQQSYHVPLLVTPWSYSTYRGS
jgi:5-hydroxyisourate hydrolase